VTDVELYPGEGSTIANYLLMRLEECCPEGRASHDWQDHVFERILDMTLEFHLMRRGVPQNTP
jgi:hypothetical protein